MKALRIYGPCKMRYEDVPKPSPGPGEVLARVHSVGLCRTDIEVYENRLYHYKIGKAMLPVIPGHEWAGVVEELGSGVTDLQLGDRITCETALGCGHCQLCLSGHQNICQDRIENGIINRNGAMAEYIVAPRSTTHRIGDLEFDAGAFIEPAAVCTYAVKTGRVCPADSVLVLGAGPIGQLLTQIAKAYGARQVVTVARKETKLQLARSLGADATINSGSEDLLEVAMALTDGLGFDVMLEAAGSAPLLQNAIGAVAVRGRIVLTGSYVGALASLDPDVIVCRELSIAGTVGGEACYEEAIGLLRSGRVRVEPLTSDRRPLSEAIGVFESLAEGAGESVKVIFHP